MGKKLTAKEAIERADVVLADLSAGGGLLQEEQADKFINFIYEAPTLLSDVRQVKMRSHTTKISKIGFGDRILKPTPGSNRALADVDRTKPQFDKVELTTQEVVAEVILPYEVLEDNLEEENLEETVMRNIATRVAIDLEELALNGDITNAADPYLALLDGYVRLISTNTVDGLNGFVDDDMLESILQTVAPKFRRPLTDMRYYTHDLIARRWARSISARGTPIGDQVLVNGGILPYAGVPVKSLDMMVEANNSSLILFCNPKNLIFGIWRNITLEVEKLIRQRSWAIVVSARVGTAIETEEACAKAYNVQVRYS
jgi:HK97 family phage major capsid protein